MFATVSLQSPSILFRVSRHNKPRQASVPLPDHFCPTNSNKSLARKQMPVIPMSLKFTGSQTQGQLQLQ